MKAEPMALLEIFGPFKDPAVLEAWGGWENLRRAYTHFKPGRKHINPSHPSPATNQCAILTTPRKIYPLCSNREFSQCCHLLGKHQLRALKKRRVPSLLPKSVLKV